jgi:hypothetical protein
VPGTGHGHGSGRFFVADTIDSMTDTGSLSDRLEQIGAQLDWVRDYL